MLKIKVTEKSGKRKTYHGDASLVDRLSELGHGLLDEYTVEIEDITAQVAQEAINAEALAYLASTDWMIIREVDSGIICPTEIKALRAEARAKVVR